MSRRACSGLVFFAVVGLAACGGGGSSPATATGAVTTPSPVTLPSSLRSYTGTRTIVAQGSPIPGIPGAASYTVGVVEQDIVPPASSPAGSTIDRHAVRTYVGAAPPNGIYLQSQTLDQYGRFTVSGLELVGTGLMTVGRDIDAESHTPGTQQIDTRSVTVSYPAGAVVIPAAAVNATLAFPRASTSHVSDSSISTNGVISANGGAGLDYTRTTNADGSYDETGFFSQVGTHAIHQHADGSATSHDQLPGFMLRDVTVSAPSGLGGAAALAVTTQTQGRTIGNPPIVMSQYQTPVWYGAAGLGNSTLAQSVNASAPAECGLGTAPVARLIFLSQYRVDVTTGVAFTENDMNYVDATGATLCRQTQDVVSQFDVTTGTRTGSATDTTVLRLVPTQSSTVTIGFGAKRQPK